MKFFVHFLMILLPLVACHRLKIQKTTLHSNHRQVLTVARIIEDWNRKYSRSNLVAVLDIGNKSDLAVDLLKVIPKENSVLIVDSKQCRKLEGRKAAFVIILSDVFDSVSVFWN